MVLLFLVAGMCSRYYLEEHTVGEFVRSRTRKLLVPSTVGVLVAGWIQGYFSMSISGAFSTMPDTIPRPVYFLIMALSGTGVLWFIQLLWLFSMLLAWIRRGEKGKLCGRTKKAGIGTALLSVIPVWLSGQVLNMPVIVVYRLGIYGFVFFLGYFVFAHDGVTDRISAFRLPLLAASAVFGAVYLFLHYGDNYAAMPGRLRPCGCLWLGDSVGNPWGYEGMGKRHIRCLTVFDKAQLRLVCISLSPTVSLCVSVAQIHKSVGASLLSADRHCGIRGCPAFV